MAIHGAARKPQPQAAEAHLARVAAQGTATHPYLARLLGPVTASMARDLADAIHLLCHLHGRHPGLIDLVLAHAAPGAVRDWLSTAADAMEKERHFLVRLTAAVGPMPSTAGAAQTEAALATQRHALETLASSERNGCAAGAAASLIGDWGAIRPLLDRVADRHNLAIPPCTLPSVASIAGAVAQAATGLAAERALTFGTEQMLLQHRGLFDLLEARAAARDAA